MPASWAPSGNWYPVKKPQPKRPVGRPKGPNRHISFYGQDFNTPSKGYSFDVLAGDEPPTIVGGYAQWQTIRRPLRRSLTIFQGYDPMSMRVSVRFIEQNAAGGWLTDNDAGLRIEKKIEILEWMAGESINVGPSPLVYLSTFDGNGNTIPLIPFEYQPATSSVPKIFGGGDVSPWIIDGGVDWDKNPVRNRGGYRIRQDAQLTVMYYQGPAGSAQNRIARPKAVVFRSRAGADTALLIARREPTAFPADLARAIVHAPQNKNLHLRSVNQKIKHGKKVVVPSGG